METKMLEFSLVLKKFSITEEQLKRAIRTMKKRHPLEKWIIIRSSPNLKDKIIYLRLEFVLWLEEVYFNRTKGFYLDKEIAFFKKQINRLEDELSIKSYPKIYDPATLTELKEMFGKDEGSIRMAIHRMKKANNNLYVRKLPNRNILVEFEGVKWLTERYYREEYLKELKEYKKILQKK